MGVKYVHCPHCTFPSVVRTIEQGFARHCKQCRRTFVPDACAKPANKQTQVAQTKHNSHRKTAIRQLLKQFATKGNH